MHIKCMKVYVEHKKQAKIRVDCPMCHIDFENLSMLQREYGHLLNHLILSRRNVGNTLELFVVAVTAILFWETVIGIFPVNFTFVIHQMCLSNICPPLQWV